MRKSARISSKFYDDQEENNLSRSRSGVEDNSRMSQNKINKSSRNTMKNNNDERNELSDLSEDMKSGSGRKI